MSGQRAAGWLAALCFRLIPEPSRFAAAVALAHALEPIVDRTRAYAERAKLRTDDLRETSLDLLLMMLTRYGATFQPSLRVEGFEQLPQPGQGPLLIVSPHTMLSMLFLRYLEDRGYSPFVIAEYPRLRIPGTRASARVLSQSPALLFRVRGLLARGRTIATMIDRDRPERRHLSVTTGAGDLFVSETCLQIALRQQAPIVFLAARMDDASNVVCRLGSPSGMARNVARIVDEFAEFVHASREIGGARRSGQMAATVTP